LAVAVIVEAVTHFRGLWVDGGDGIVTIVVLFHVARGRAARGGDIVLAIPGTIHICIAIVKHRELVDVLDHHVQSILRNRAEGQIVECLRSQRKDRHAEQQRAGGG